MNDDSRYTDGIFIIDGSPWAFHSKEKRDETKLSNFGQSVGMLLDPGALASFLGFGLSRCGRL